MLLKIVGSQGRAEILKNLFTREKLSLHLRELARRANLSAPMLLRELRQLVETGLITETKDGNRVLYKANPEHPLYATMCDLVRKTDGMADTLKSVLSDEKIDTAFIFGSIASGTETAKSDIDVFVIGDIGLREVTRRINQVADSLGRIINPFVISLNEFISRRKHGDHFITEISTAPKIFLKGSANEFERLEKQRLAPRS